MYKRARDLGEEYAEQAAMRRHFELVKFGVYTNDDFCKTCGEGGDLVCCDGCPAAFHQKRCAGVGSLKDKYFCKNCVCAACNKRGTALFTCGQCGIRVHPACASGLSFCSSTCRKLNMSIQELIGRANKLEEGLTWSILNGGSDPASVEEALRVLKQGFLPVVNTIEDIDYLPGMVYNKGNYIENFDFSKFFIMVLRRHWVKKSTIVCVALLRLHGSSLAELPFITTRRTHEGKGYCRKLMNVIERMLVGLNVKQITLLAAEDIHGMWKSKFGFKTPTRKSPFNLIELTGGSFLEKKL